ncbi:MAG: Tex family protein [Pseudomonadota bacterium]
MTSIDQQIAHELNVKVPQVSAAIELLNEGATIPFIARYRKEKTGGLDDGQLRKLEQRLGYLQQLAERKTAVRKAIDEQGKLTPELARAIEAAQSKIDLEDLYAPYKQKRRTKGQIAREAGLEPLADALLSNPSLDPSTEALKYCGPESAVTDAKSALEGAQSILVERMAEEPQLVGRLRDWLWSDGRIFSKAARGKQAEAEKFADYFEFQQPIREIPSHRALALLRGRNESLLSLRLDVDHADPGHHPGAVRVMTQFGISDRGRSADNWLVETAEAAWKGKLHPALTTSLLARVKEQADAAAIDVFKTNLKDLLLAAPAGQRTTMGLDPGIRTGVKIAVVDQTGKLIETATVYPHEPRNDWRGALATLAGLCAKHAVELIAVGNGTASRETDKLAGEVISQLESRAIAKVMVSEAGASVYSASQLAADEFPDLDVSLRGAVSIARRLQDPLAELVKIEPKAIGVGQYQHDVNQSELASSLDAAVEDCVNLVGVDINTASVPLLSSVAGLNATIAQNIVNHRNENGAFKKRTEMKKVARLGPKAFEQAAGFLRIMDGPNPLDASAVHPEAYEVVERIAKAKNRSVKSMVGDDAFLKTVQPDAFVDDRFGLPTVRDILAELEKPGRDPRPEFRTARFSDSVEKITDLASGMRLEGVVTNVTAFGAFVDVGVHQDGLVHISELADQFVKDPRDIVKAGDVVNVRVKDVDVGRKRIGLSMKSQSKDDNPQADELSQPAKDTKSGKGQGRAERAVSQAAGLDGESALAAALRRAQGGKRAG